MHDTKGKAVAREANGTTSAHPSHEHSTNGATFTQRVATSASTLFHSALSLPPKDANATLAANLQAAEKASGAPNAVPPSSSHAESSSSPAPTTTRQPATQKTLDEPFRSHQPTTSSDLDPLAKDPSLPLDVIPPIEAYRASKNTTNPKDLSHINAYDGYAVTALLSTGGALDSERELLTDDRAPPTEPNDPQLQHLTQSLRNALPSPPTHGVVAIENPLNLRPDGYADDDVFLSEWREVMERYTDDVWDPASRPWLQEAREEMKRLNKSTSEADDEARAQAVRRLRGLLGHVRAPAAMEEEEESRVSRQSSAGTAGSSGTFGVDSPLASWDAGWVGEMGETGCQG